MNIYQTLQRDYNSGVRVLRPLTQESSDWMLECLPPARLGGGGYVNSEPYTYSPDSGKCVYFCCITKGGKDYGVYGSLNEYDSGKLAALPLDTGEPL